MLPFLWMLWFTKTVTKFYFRISKISWGRRNILSF